MRALVTGAGGFVGAHLAARLVADGWDVVAALRPGGSPWRLAALGADRAEVREADLTDPAATAALAGAAAPDVVFHLAAARAAAGPGERRATMAVNASSGAWLVDGLPGSCRAVVRLGSSTEYAEWPGPMDERTPLAPRGFFGATKAAGSLLVAAAAEARGLRAAVLRAFQVYGALDHPGRLVPTVLRAAAEGGEVRLTEPGRCRDWVHVDDVVEACMRAATASHLPGGTVVNVGTGRQTANEELVELARRVTGCEIRAVTGAHPGRSWDTASWVCDPGRAAELLGWRPTVGLEEGLARCWARVSAGGRG